MSALDNPVWWFHQARRCTRRDDAFHAGDGFLYIAEIIGADAIKIGYSRSPASRLYQFGSRLKRPVRLLLTSPSSHEDEIILHARMAEHRHPDFPSHREIYPTRVLCNGWVPTHIRIPALRALRKSAQATA
jgi:hypothetical protein